MRVVSVRDTAVKSIVAVAERADTSKPGNIGAPFAGVVTVTVAEGDTVEAGQPVATIEAMKMEAAITTPVAGTVERVVLGHASAVEGGDLLLVVKPSA
jgi:pyruvate carboxylase